MTFREVRCFAVAAVFLWSTAAYTQTVAILLERGAFRVSGWTAPQIPPAKGWSSILAVYAGAGDVPRLLGAYAVEGGYLVFHAKFPLAPGVRYRAVFRAPGGPAVERTFDGPPKETVRMARVDRVYPSGDVLPSNLLRLYVYFSAPMSQGEAGQRMHLLDEKGNPLRGVFLPGEELWDPGFERLTMTFDPGRIKRGLTSNEAMGPPIAAGRRYTLVIDSDWRDARDVPMAAGFRKEFRGAREERTQPDPNRWIISAPKAGSTSALTVDFGKPMNYVLLQRMLRVVSGSQAVSGAVGVERQESRWLFTPREAWKVGDYRLVVDTALEDLAGNSIALAFDIDVFDRVTDRIASTTIALPFRIQ